MFLTKYAVAAKRYFCWRLFPVVDEYALCAIVSKVSLKKGLKTAVNVSNLEYILVIKCVYCTLVSLLLFESCKPYCVWCPLVLPQH